MKPNIDLLDNSISLAALENNARLVITAFTYPITSYLLLTLDKSTVDCGEENRLLVMQVDDILLESLCWLQRPQIEKRQLVARKWRDLVAGNGRSLPLYWVDLCLKVCRSISKGKKAELKLTF